ncbi:hypothetical protein NG42_08960 [Winslowiella iniecta]|uniref:Uncharacterized protein n=2 Tax=Winslowiella iniecta TaxID=1560201 RepID=A0A0L7T5M0_9GAMM|nr:hypothetical protein NG42_08960 [Winslowiella iniecta]KOC93635.1 hypothetical protein NG43_09100 [Winslowiella iniecta]
MDETFIKGLFTVEKKTQEKLINRLDINMLPGLFQVILLTLFLYSTMLNTGCFPSRNHNGESFAD